MNKPLTAEQREARAQRLLLLGVLTELTPEQRAQFDAAVADVKAAAEKHGDMGTMALTMVMLEHAEAQA